jgi:hypothetical protein
MTESSGKILDAIPDIRMVDAIADVTMLHAIADVHWGNTICVICGWL